jgi:5-methylcytosine-specific restriction endonuclease McrA
MAQTVLSVFAVKREVGEETLRIPKDISLATYIRRLIAADKIAVFYQTEDWKELRQNVLEFFYFECQECLKKGKYTKADCVHHVNEVKHRPDLALSRTFIDDHGQQQYQLVPLCNICHNQVHDKLGEWQRKDKFTNEERWD